MIYKEGLEKLGYKKTDKIFIDMVWWVEEGGLPDIYTYVEAYKHQTDTTEKFNEFDHGKVCCICGQTSHRFRHFGKYYCVKHLRQLQIYGNVKSITERTPNELIFCEEYTKLITRGKFGDSITGQFLISDESVKDVIGYKWKKHSSGYAFNSKWSLKLHDVVFKKRNTSLTVDHLDRDRSNNRLSNLELKSMAENLKNKSVYRCNKTGFSGITKSKTSEKFHIAISLNGKSVYLGIEDNIEDAIKLRLTEEVKHYPDKPYDIALLNKYGIPTEGIKPRNTFKENTKISLQKAIEIYALLLELKL